MGIPVGRECDPRPRPRIKIEGIFSLVPVLWETNLHLQEPESEDDLSSLHGVRSAILILVTELPSEDKFSLSPSPQKRNSSNIGLREYGTIVIPISHVLFKNHFSFFLIVVTGNSIK